MGLDETISDASRGDADAIESLLERFLPGLQNYIGKNAGRLVQAKESRADIAQSVCREVLERLRDERLEYRGEAEFKQWLYQAAVHKLQNRHRFYKAGARDAAREVRPGPGSDDGGDTAARDALVASLSSPSQHAMKREDVEKLELALDQLPENHREVIRLARVEGLSHGEIAARLGISESNSRVLLARAMARVARIVQRESKDV